MKKITLLLLICLSIGLIECKKDKADNTPLMAVFFGLASSNGSNNSVALSAYRPVGRKLSATAGSTLVQKVNISGSSSILANTRSTPLPPTTLTLSIYKTDGSFLDGCPDVVSAPGDTSVTMTCNVTETGTFILQMTSSATAFVSFDAPKGATVVATNGSNGFESLPTIFADSDNTNTTKNILLTAVLQQNQVIIFLRTINPTTKVATDITDATVKATFKSNAETTLPYTTSIYGIPGMNGYADIANSKLPNFTTSATGGDTLRLVITGPNNSFTVDKTLTYPNSITNLKIDGNLIAYGPGSAHSVSRATGATISWTNPNSNPPQFVGILAGDNINDSSIPWRASFPVAASSGTYSIPSSVLTSFSTSTSTTSNDNCLGSHYLLTGNYTMFPTFYNGEVKLNGQTTAIPQSSLIVIGNTSGTNNKNYACETNVMSLTGSTFGSSTNNPILTLTD